MSRRISLLEAKLEGERLLTRSTRRLNITEFGERILDHAKRLLEETESALAMAQHRQGSRAAYCGFRCHPISSNSDLIAFASPVRRFLPPEVRLELDLSPRRVDLLVERFDLAVRAASRLPDDGTLVAYKLCEMPNGLYASPAYIKRYGLPANPPELLDHIGLRLIGGNGEPLPWRLSRGYIGRGRRTDLWRLTRQGCSVTLPHMAWGLLRWMTGLPISGSSRVCSDVFCRTGACRSSLCGACCLAGA